MRLNSAKHSSAVYRVKTGFATPSQRSWDDLNQDILVDIMKRVPRHDRLYSACLVSKSWLSAVFDTLSPSGVINLGVLDRPKYKRLSHAYLHFLKRMLVTKPPNFWTTLRLGETLLKSKRYVYIAKRTPFMQRLIIPEVLGNTYSCFTQAMCHWRKLKYVQCNMYLFRFCIGGFNRVESLRLFGVVDDHAAKAIRDRCPRLKRLFLKSCALSMNALSTILDGHKNLEVLDTRHCFRVRDCPRTASSGKSKSVEWNEEEIRQKAANVKVHLRCTKERCPKCSATYKCCFPKCKGRFLSNDRFWEYL